MAAFSQTAELDSVTRASEKKQKQSKRKPAAPVTPIANPEIATASPSSI
jgi:hypothetical protein